MHGHTRVVFALAALLAASAAFEPGALYACRCTMDRELGVGVSCVRQAGFAEWPCECPHPRPPIHTDGTDTVRYTAAACESSYSEAWIDRAAVSWSGAGADAREADLDEFYARWLVLADRSPVSRRPCIGPPDRAVQQEVHIVASHTSVTVTTVVYPCRASDPPRCDSQPSEWSMCTPVRECGQQGTQSRSHTPCVGQTGAVRETEVRECLVHGPRPLCDSERVCEPSEQTTGGTCGGECRVRCYGPTEPQTCVTEHRCNLTWSRDPDQWLPVGSVRPVALLLGEDESARDCGPAWQNDPNRRRCLADSCAFSGHLSELNTTFCACDRETCGCPAAWPNATWPCAYTEIEQQAPDPVPYCGAGAVGHLERCTRAGGCAPVPGTCECEQGTAPWPGRDGTPCAGRVVPCATPALECGADAVSCERVSRFGAPLGAPTDGDWVRCASGKRGARETDPETVKALCGPGGLSVYTTDEGIPLKGTCECAGVTVHDWEHAAVCPGVLPYHSYPCTDRDYEANGCTLPREQCRMLVSPQTSNMAEIVEPSCTRTKRAAPTAQAVTACTSQQVRQHCGRGTASCSWNGTVATCVCARTGYSQHDYDRPCTGREDVRFACSPFLTRKFCGSYSGPSAVVTDAAVNPRRIQTFDVCSYSPYVAIATPPSLVCPYAAGAVHRQCTAPEVGVYCPQVGTPASNATGCMVRCVGSACDLWGVCEFRTPCTALQVAKCPNSKYAAACTAVNYQTLTGVASLLANCTWDCSTSTEVTGPGCNITVPRACTYEEAEAACGPNNASYTSCTRTGTDEPVCVCATNYAQPQSPSVLNATNPFAVTFKTFPGFGQCAGYQTACTSEMVKSLVGPFGTDCQAYCLETTDPRLVQLANESGIDPEEIVNWTSSLRLCRLVPLSWTCRPGSAPDPSPYPGDPLSVVRPCGVAHEDLVDSTLPLLLTECGGPTKTLSATARVFYNSSAMIYRYENLDCTCRAGYHEGTVFQCETTHYERPCNAAELANWIEHLPAVCPGGVLGSVAGSCAVKCVPGGTFLPSPEADPVEVNGTELCYGFRDAQCAGEANTSVCTFETAQRECGAYAAGCRGVCTTEVQLVRSVTGVNTTGDYYTPRLVQTCNRTTIRCSCQTLYPNYAPDEMNRPCGRAYVVRSCTSLAEATRFCGLGGFACSKRCRFSSKYLATLDAADADLTEQDCYEAHVCRCANDPPLELMIDPDTEPEYFGSSHLARPLYRSCGFDAPVSRCTALANPTSVTGPQCGALAHAERVGLNNTRLCVCKEGTEDLPLGNGLVRPCSAYVRDCEDFEVTHYCPQAGRCKLLCDTQRNSWCQLKPGSCMPAPALPDTGQVKRVCITDLLRSASCTLNCTAVTQLECQGWVVSRHPNANRCFRVAEAPSVTPVLATEGASSAYWQYCQLPNTPACRRAGGLDQVYTGRNCFEIAVNATGERVCTSAETQRYCGDPSLVADCRMSFWGSFARFVEGTCRCKPFPAAVTVPATLYVLDGAGSTASLPEPAPACIPLSGVTEQLVTGCTDLCGRHTVLCRRRYVVYPLSRTPDPANPAATVRVGDLVYNTEQVMCWSRGTGGLLLRTGAYYPWTERRLDDLDYLRRVYAGEMAFNSSYLCTMGLMPPGATNAQVEIMTECGCEADMSAWGSLVRGAGSVGLDWRGGLASVGDIKTCDHRDTAELRALYASAGRVPIGGNGLACGGVFRHKPRPRPVDELSQSASDPRVWPMSRILIKSAFDSTGYLYVPIPTSAVVPVNDKRIRRSTDGVFRRPFVSQSSDTLSRWYNYDIRIYNSFYLLANIGCTFDGRCNTTGEIYYPPELYPTTECRAIPYPLPPQTENAFTEVLSGVALSCTPKVHMLMSEPGSSEQWKKPPGADRCTQTKCDSVRFRNGTLEYLVDSFWESPYNRLYINGNTNREVLGFWSDSDESALAFVFNTPLANSFSPVLEPPSSTFRFVDNWYTDRWTPYAEYNPVSTFRASKFNRNTTRIWYVGTLMCSTTFNMSSTRAFPEGDPVRRNQPFEGAQYSCAPDPVATSGEQLHRYKCVGIHTDGGYQGKYNTWPVQRRIAAYSRNFDNHRMMRVHCHQKVKLWYDNYAVGTSGYGLYPSGATATYVDEGPEPPWLQPGCFDSPEADEFPTPNSGCAIDGLSGALCDRRDAVTKDNPFFEGLCGDTALVPSLRTACCIGSSTPCAIPAGWTGRQGCINGEYSVANSSCVCDPPWSIPGTFTFNVPDSDRGRCINHPCMNPGDNRRNRTTPMCSGNGACFSGACTCFEGWAGRWCEVPSAWACPPTRANSSDDVLAARAVIKHEMDQVGATLQNAWWGPTGRSATFEAILPCGGRGVPTAVGSTCECRCYAGDYGTWSGAHCTELDFTHEEDRDECDANGGELAVHVLADGNATRHGSVSMPYLYMPVAAYCKCPLAPGSQVHSFRTGRNCELEMCPVGPNGLVCSGRGTCTLGESADAVADANRTPYPMPVCQQQASALALCGEDNDNCVFAVQRKQVEPVVLCGNTTRYTGCACELDRWVDCVPPAHRGDARPTVCSYTGNGKSAQENTLAHIAAVAVEQCKPFLDGSAVRHYCDCPYPDDTDTFCSGDVCRARHTALGLFEEPFASIFFPTGETCNGQQGTIANDTCDCTCSRTAPFDGTLRTGRYCQFDVTDACGSFNGDAGVWRMCNSDRVDGNPPQCRCNGTFAEDTGCTGGIFRCEGCPPGREGLRCELTTCPLACGPHGDCVFDGSNHAFCSCAPRWDNTGSRTTPCDKSICAEQNAIPNPDSGGDPCVCLDRNLTVASNCRFGACPSVEGSICGTTYSSPDADPLTSTAQRKGCTDRSRCNTDGKQCFAGVCSCVAPRYVPGSGGTCVARCDTDNTLEIDIFNLDYPCVCRQGFSRLSDCRDVECPTTVLASSVALAVVYRETDASGLPVCRCPFPFISNCTAHLCQNGGRPAKVGIDLACACATGFQGPLCESAISEPAPAVVALPPTEDPVAPDPPAPSEAEKSNAIATGVTVVVPPVSPPLPVSVCYNGGVLNPAAGTCTCGISHYGPDCRYNYCGFGASARVCRGTIGSCYCVCDPNGYWDFDEFGNCTKTVCGTNSVLTGSECVCNAGFVKSNATGLCTAQCAGNSTWSPRRRACVCNPGYSGSRCTVAAVAAAASPEVLTTVTTSVRKVADPPKTKLDSGPCGTALCAASNDMGLSVSDTEPPPGIDLGGGGALNPVKVHDAERPPVELVYPSKPALSPAQIAAITAGSLVGTVAVGYAALYVSRAWRMRAEGYRGIGKR